MVKKFVLFVQAGVLFYIYVCCILTKILSLLSCSWHAFTTAEVKQFFHRFCGLMLEYI